MALTKKNAAHKLKHKNVARLGGWKICNWVREYIVQSMTCMFISASLHHARSARWGEKKTGIVKMGTVILQLVTAKHSCMNPVWGRGKVSIMYMHALPLDTTMSTLRANQKPEVHDSVYCLVAMHRHSSQALTLQSNRRFMTCHTKMKSELEFREKKQKNKNSCQ